MPACPTRLRWRRRGCAVRQSVMMVCVFACVTLGMSLRTTSGACSAICARINRSHQWAGVRELGRSGSWLRYRGHLLVTQRACGRHACTTHVKGPLQSALKASVTTGTSGSSATRAGCCRHVLDMRARPVHGGCSTDSAASLEAGAVCVGSTTTMNHPPSAPLLTSNLLESHPGTQLGASPTSTAGKALPSPTAACATCTLHGYAPYARQTTSSSPSATRPSGTVCSGTGSTLPTPKASIASASQPAAGASARPLKRQPRKGQPLETQRKSMQLASRPEMQGHHRTQA